MHRFFPIVILLAACAETTVPEESTPVTPKRTR